MKNVKKRDRSKALAEWRLKNGLTKTSYAHKDLVDAVKGVVTGDGDKTRQAIANLPKEADIAKSVITELKNSGLAIPSSSPSLAPPTACI